MKKNSSLSFLLLFILFCAIVFGLGNRTNAQTPLFTLNLDIGVRGSEVTALQKCLTEQGLFSLTPTGYYGLITASSVMQFQVKNNIVSSGTASTTGYGRVGPKTRAMLNAKCGTVSVVVPPTPVKEGSNVVFGDGKAPVSHSPGEVWVDVKANDSDTSQTVSSGAAVSLSWEADPRTSSTMVCTGSGSAMGASGIDAKLWNGNKSYTGIVVVHPTVTTTYTIACTDTINGVASTQGDSIVVNVQ